MHAKNSRVVLSFSREQMALTLTPGNIRKGRAVARSSARFSSRNKCAAVALVVQSVTAKPSDDRT